MKNKIKEILKGTYFDKNMSLGTVCIFLIGNSILVTALFSIGIFLFLGVISLIISYLLSLVGIVNIVDKIVRFSSVVAIIGGLACCMAYGATKGTESFKDYLRLPLNELEATLNNLSFEKQNELTDKISTYIHKSINRCHRDGCTTDNIISKG
jgi:hypothetical protein